MKPKHLWSAVALLCVVGGLVIFGGGCSDATDDSAENGRKKAPETIGRDAGHTPERPAMRRLKEDPARQWAQWRGPLGTGVAPHTEPPVEWGEDKNVRWKVAIRGKGHSTPIVWGGRLFVTAAVPVGDSAPRPLTPRPGAHHGATPPRRQEFVVLAISRKDGQVIWRKAVGQARPHEDGHYTGSYASASPVAAAGRVYITSINGATVVLKHGGEPKVLAVNQLDDRFNASAALAEGDLYLRGEKHLYCLKKTPQDTVRQGQE